MFEVGYQRKEGNQILLISIDEVDKITSTDQEQVIALVSHSPSRNFNSEINMN